MDTFVPGGGAGDGGAELPHLLPDVLAVGKRPRDLLGARAQSLGPGAPDRRLSRAGTYRVCLAALGTLMCIPQTDQAHTRVHTAAVQSLPRE
eukprot:1174652-Rhodomonas_salina.1